MLSFRSSLVTGIKRAKLGAGIFAFLVSGSVLGAASISTSTDFLPADSARDYMDVGGVWDGSNEVTNTTGDTLEIVLDNNGDGFFDSNLDLQEDLFDAAENLELEVTLPAGVNYVAGTAVASVVSNTNPLGSCSAPSLSPNFDSGSGLLSFGLSGYTLSEGCEIRVRYGVAADTSASPAQYLLPVVWRHDTSGGDQTQNQSLQIYGGKKLLEISPSQQTATVNSTVNWTVTVRNVGLGTGGLFDVVIDESAINPNPAGSLQITSIAASNCPALSSVFSTAGNGTNDSALLNYLAAGEICELNVQATVDMCANIDNTVALRDRVDTVGVTQSAQVELDLDQPLIEFMAPTGSFDYSGPESFSFLVENTEMGDAKNLVIASNLHNEPVTVSAVSADWSYNASNGEFTYVGNGGSGIFANQSNSTLSFDLEHNDVCVESGSILTTWVPAYTDVCDNPYATPTRFSTIGGADGPMMSLLKEATGTDTQDRLEVGTSAGFLITASADNTHLIDDTTMTVRDVLPTELSNYSVVAPLGTSYTCGGDLLCAPGEELVWTLPVALLAGNPQLQINYDAPTDACTAGSGTTNTAIADTLRSTASTPSEPSGCPLDAQSSANLIFTNGADGNMGPNEDVEFNPGTPATGTAFESGLPDQNGNGVLHERGFAEAEAIPWSAEYTFPAGYAGSWNGASYTDDLTDANEQYIADTAEVEVDTVIYPVPAGNISGGSAGVPLALDLTYLSAALGSSAIAPIADRDVTIRYETVVSDAGTGARQHVSVLRIPGASGGGSCASGGDAVFTQVATVNVAQVAASIGVSGVPSTVDICEPFNTTLNANTVDNGTAELAHNISVRLLTSGDYELVDNPPSPIYGGQFAGTGISQTVNAGDVEWTLDDQAEGLNGGDVTVELRRKPLTSSGFSAATPVSAEIDFDDNQTWRDDFSDADRDFTAAGSASPTVIRAGELSITTTPQNFTVTGDQAKWQIYVTNGGDGVAYGSVLENSIPAQLSIDVAATNAANNGRCNINPRNLVAVPSGSDVSWDLGDLEPGETCQVEVITDVLSSSSCSIPDGSSVIRAAWGCGGVEHQSVAASDPDFLFLDGDLLVSHLVSSFCALCDEGEVSFRVTNVGASYLYDVVITEDLDADNVGTGQSYVSGSAEASTDGGSSFFAIADPAISGDTLTWDSGDIPDLAELAPSNQAGVSDIIVRFRTTSSEAANANPPKFEVRADGVLGCGNPISQTENPPFEVDFRRPDFTVEKLGRNLSTSPSGPYEEQVPAAAGDIVEWQVTLNNNGNFEARNVRMVDFLPATGLSLTLISGPGILLPLPYASGSNFTVPNIPAGGSVTYLLQQTLGFSCINAFNTAEVTWGCVSNGANAASNLTTPSDNDDTAELLMLPSASGDGELSQSFTPLDSGRGEISITVVNSGGRMDSPVIVNDLPDDYHYDASFTPVVTPTGGAGVSTVTVDASNLNVPEFTAVGTNDFDPSGSLRDGEGFTLTFRIIPNTGFDTTADPLQNPETEANTLDPAPPQDGDNTVTLNYDSSCGVGNSENSVANIDPFHPDIDIDVSPSNQLVEDATSYTYSFTLSNNGETASTAADISFVPTLGAGWTAAQAEVITAGTGGTTGVCASLSSCDIGSLDEGDSAVIEITATANDNGSSLSLSAEVFGNLFADDGSDTTNDYSYDSARPRIIGLSLSKDLIATSETATANDEELAYGEEATWLLRMRVFGGASFSNVVLRDSLPAGIGYVSHIATVNNSVTISGLSGNTPVASDVVEFTVDDFNDNGTFEVELVGRMLNYESPAPEALAHDASLLNAFGASFDADGDTWASDDPVDGFGGNYPGLHDEDTVTVKHPNIGIEKRVRNGSTGSYVDLVQGDAGDVFEFELSISNPTGFATSYDIAVEDTLDARLQAVDPASDGLDNDADGSVDEADEANILDSGGAQDVIRFNNTPLLSGGAENGVRFDEIAAGDSFTLYFRAVALSTVVPGLTISNTASVSADSLPGESGSQTAGTEGSSGSLTGAREISDSDDAAIEVIDSTTITKEGNLVSDASGVQFIAWRIVIDDIPEGTSDNFVVSDTLPAGVEFTGDSDIALGRNMNSSVTPSDPSAGATSHSWNFGTVINDGSFNLGEDDSIVIEYLTEVVDPVSDSLTNAAVLSFDNAAGTTTLNAEDTVILALNRFYPDNQATIEPGTQIFYAHSFVAGSSGDLSYSLPVTQSADPGWSSVLYLDANCNGLLDAGESSSIAPADVFSISAGSRHCIIHRVSAPNNVSPGAQYRVDILASFSFGGGSSVTREYSNTDLTQAVESGVVLRKTVSNISNPLLDDSPISNRAGPGDVLRYTIEYRNHGTKAVSNFVVNDRTPAFSNFEAPTAATCAAAGASYVSLGGGLSGCTISGPGFGGEGDVEWQFNGDLQPGATGSISFDVRVAQ